MGREEESRSQRGVLSGKRSVAEKCSEEETAGRGGGVAGRDRRAVDGCREERGGAGNVGCHASTR